jgi:hypothetical protein
MTSPEERREAQIRAIGQGGQFNELTDFGLEIFGATLDRLLAYFDENEPETADLIRYGRDRQSTGVVDRNGQIIRVGDIVETWADLSRSYVRVVVREPDQPEITFEPRTGFILCGKNSRHFEVLGNIYENPDGIPEWFRQQS